MSYSHSLSSSQNSIININEFESFILNLIMDMHGNVFGVPIKDQDPIQQVSYHYHLPNNINDELLRVRIEYINS